MVKDAQFRRLIMLIKKEKTLAIAASMAGMDEKTARKYLNAGVLPSQLKTPHDWRTHADSFEDVWDELVPFLENPGIEGKTLFLYLQRQYPGRFADGQLRTLQRKLKRWRALEGPGKEVIFPQEHHPGERSSSDFTHMDKLRITIDGKPFDHLIYHFVLPYSNWEAGYICFSESFESLSEGLQNAFWELGGVTKKHRTDNLSAAVYIDLSEKRFTPRYRALLSHYKVEGETINAGCPGENGDAEQSHHRFKKSVEQALLLRSSRDFASLKDYESFLRNIFRQLNINRNDRFQEELKHLRRLPEYRLDDFKILKVKVGRSSTISVCQNVYSVHNRLIGENVTVRLYSNHLEVWYAQRMVEQLPRLRGKSQHHIEYRHIIDWLVRKPGAFVNYRYRDDLFPTVHFRMVYDYLSEKRPASASREYLEILHLASRESEWKVDQAIQGLFACERELSLDEVRKLVESIGNSCELKEVQVRQTNLSDYNRLYSAFSHEAIDGNCYQ